MNLLDRIIKIIEAMIERRRRRQFEKWFATSWLGKKMKEREEQDCKK